MDEKAKTDALLSRAMALCAGREFCKSEIRAKLEAWGADDQLNHRIIERLVKDKFIDEVRYSNAFVKDKFRYNKWGKVKISAHLRAKNIDGEIIKEALGSIDDETYESTIRDLIFSHRKKTKARNPYELKGKLLRFGLSRGFESHLLYDILNEES